jgi:uncharacterized protein (DUF2267 family)
MKQYRWQIVLGTSLIVLSALLYLFHYALFHDVHHILIYLVGDIAFVPVEVLFVTLIIHQLLNQREKRSRLEKLNMVIGAFFSEAGTELLAFFSDLDPELTRIQKFLVIEKEWTHEKFAQVHTQLKQHAHGIAIEKVNLAALRTFLKERRDFLLRLLENPNLLEHESFTSLLWAVFHLTDELVHRKDVENLPDSDRAHLAGDIKRAYGLLVSEWLDYMGHLKDNYAYLFSLAMRTNPFDEKASVIVS